METESIFRAATLWFIVVIYFNMESGALGPPFVEIVDFVGLLLFFPLPIYLLIGTVRTLVRRDPVKTERGETPR